MPHYPSIVVCYVWATFFFLVSLLGLLRNERTSVKTLMFKILDRRSMEKQWLNNFQFSFSQNLNASYDFLENQSITIDHSPGRYPTNFAAPKFFLFSEFFSFIQTQNRIMYIWLVTYPDFILVNQNNPLHVAGKSCSKNDFIICSFFGWGLNNFAMHQFFHF